MIKLFTDKSDFEKYRRHLDIIRVAGADGKKPHPGFPETLAMCTIGLRCPIKVAEKGLATHWDDGIKRKGYEEYALNIPADLLATCHNHKATIDGKQHTFDLSVLCNDYPEEWKNVEGTPEVEPAPKSDTAIATLEGIPR